VQVFKLRNIGILIGFFSVVVYARKHIYNRVAEESATLGKELLAKNSRNLVETIEAVSKDPETLSALKVLLVQLLQAESTRTALLDLLYYTFQDEKLCETTGAFLLRSLDTEASRKSLRAQTASLASDTVQDPIVQRDAAAAVNQILLQATASALIPTRWFSSTPTPTPQPPPPTPPTATATNVTPGVAEGGSTTTTGTTSSKIDDSTTTTTVPPAKTTSDASTQATSSKNEEVIEVSPFNKKNSVIKADEQVKGTKKSGDDLEQVLPVDDDENGSVDPADQTLKK
jgi:hypothetical protein